MSSSILTDQRCEKGIGSRALSFMIYTVSLYTVRVMELCIPSKWLDSWKMTFLNSKSHHDYVTNTHLCTTIHINYVHFNNKT